MESIGGFRLRNNGGFVCAGRVQYIDANGAVQLSERWGFIAIGQSETMRPSERGVPDGAVVRIHVDIQAGDGRTGAPDFIYDAKLTSFAEYDITGTARDSDLHFDGVKG